MNIGRKFGIANVITSTIEIIGIIMIASWAITAIDTNDVTNVEVPILAVIIMVIGVMSKFVIGICQLCIVTKEKTKHRGLHIANGVLSIIGGIISVIIIGIIIIYKENEITE